MANSEAIEWADQQVKDAYNVWLWMMAYDWPVNQVLAVQDELQGRITLANRIQRIHEKLSKKHGHTKKHR